MIIRAAEDHDADQMAALLNQIIEVGGTTAIERGVTIDDLRAWMSRAPGQSIWTVADDDGAILGFQWVEPHPNLPRDAVDIASFVKIGVTGKGVGRKLFEATCAGCRELGLKWINAAIRSDNESGLRYYHRMGFKDWSSDPTVTLSNGTVTGKTYKRFDL
ncbi:MAG: GNAT family N-acetyltransferase [Pseudomonadota bacterium]